MRSIICLFSSICLLPIVIFGENKEDREIVITGNDAMQFDLKEFRLLGRENHYYFQKYWIVTQNCHGA